MKAKGDKGDSAIWEELEVSKATFYRYMKWIEEENAWNKINNPLN